MLCILKGILPFKMHKIIFFYKKFFVCLQYPTNNFQTSYPKHTYFHYLVEDCVDVQADLSIHWVHIPSCAFCYVRLMSD